MGNRIIGWKKLILLQRALSDIKCSVTLIQVVIRLLKLFFLSIVHAFQKNLKGTKKHSMKNKFAFS